MGKLGKDELFKQEMADRAKAELFAARRVRTRDMARESIVERGQLTVLADPKTIKALYALCDKEVVSLPALLRFLLEEILLEPEPYLVNAIHKAREEGKIG